MKEPKDAVILIVDDEEDLREAIAFDFRRKKYQVLLAASGNEAFKLIEKTQVDVVISDVRMPDGDGISLLERIKTRDPWIPVVMLITGFADISLEEAYDKGADVVFSKPFERNALFGAVSRALFSFDEKHGRAEGRVEAEISIGLKFLKSGHQLQTKTFNIGRGGIFVVLPEGIMPEVGEQAQFLLEYGLHPFDVEGRGLVRWVRRAGQSGLPGGCGMEFEWLTPNSIRHVVELINEVKTKAFIPRK
ncbi:MAG: response regulator [Bdellovibrionota bacterium]